MWKHQLDILPEHTYAPNLYRCGSDIKQWAEQCARLVPEGRFVVVGCSVGGSCALEILDLAPDRVAATILIGTKARHDPDPVFASEARKLVENQGVKAAWKELWEPLCPQRDYGEAHMIAQAIALDQSPENLINGLTAFHTRASREDTVMNSKSPIHVVSGDQDEFPGLDYSGHLAALNPKARRHIIKGCGHYVPIMRPIETNVLIADVISQISAA